MCVPANLACNTSLAASATDCIIPCAETEAADLESRPAHMDRCKAGGTSKCRTPHIVVIACGVNCGTMDVVKRAQHVTPERAIDSFSFTAKCKEHLENTNKVTVLLAVLRFDVLR